MAWTLRRPSTSLAAATLLLDVTGSDVLRWVLIGGVVYIALLALAFLAEDSFGWLFPWLGLPFAAAYLGLRRLRGDPEAIVTSTLRALRPSLRRRSPAIARTHAFGWSEPELRVEVYFVCAEERDVPLLEAQLPELASLLGDALRRRGAAALPDAVSVHAASKGAIERYGGAYHYFHDAPHRRHN